jgi:hypothetical protein
MLVLGECLKINEGMTMRLSIRNLSAALLVAGTTGLSAVSALAIPVTLNFTGTVQFASVGAVPLGAALSGSLTYESTALDTAAPFWGGTLGSYVGAITSLTYSIGTFFGSSGGGSIGIGNNFNPFIPPSFQSDTFQALGGSSFTSISGAGNLDFQFRLNDGQATAFSGTSGPSPLPLNASFFSGGAFGGVSSADEATFSLFSSSGAFAGLSDAGLIQSQFGPLALLATIETVTSASVSEPAIIALFVFGAAGLGWVNRRAKKKANAAQESEVSV